MLIEGMEDLSVEDRLEALRKMTPEQIRDGPKLYGNFRNEGVPEHTNVPSPSNMSVDSVGDKMTRSSNRG